MKKPPPKEWLKKSSELLPTTQIDLDKRAAQHPDMRIVHPIRDGFLRRPYLTIRLLGTYCKFNSTVTDTR